MEGRLHQAFGQWWLTGEDGSIGVAVVEAGPWMNDPRPRIYLVSGPLVKERFRDPLVGGKDCDSLEAAKSWAEDIAKAAGHTISPVGWTFEAPSDH